MFTGGYGLPLAWMSTRYNDRPWRSSGLRIHDSIPDNSVEFRRYGEPTMRHNQVTQSRFGSAPLSFFPLPLPLPLTVDGMDE